MSSTQEARTDQLKLNETCRATLIEGSLSESRGQSQTTLPLEAKNIQVNGVGPEKSCPT